LKGINSGIENLKKKYPGGSDDPEYGAGMR
jgi:hypothetical protein